LWSLRVNHFNAVAVKVVRVVPANMARSLLCCALVFSIFVQDPVIIPTPRPRSQKLFRGYFQNLMAGNGTPERELTVTVVVQYCKILQQSLEMAQVRFPLYSMLNLLTGLVLPERFFSLDILNLLAALTWALRPLFPGFLLFPQCLPPQPL